MLISPTEKGRWHWMPTSSTLTCEINAQNNIGILGKIPL